MLPPTSDGAEAPFAAEEREALLEGLRWPWSRADFMSAVAEMPLQAQLVLVQDLAALRDPRALPFFAALLHAPESDLVLAALDALQELATGAGTPLAAERARCDADPAVRRRAADVAQDLDSQPVLMPQPVDLGQVENAFLTTLDSDGGQIALLARRPPVELGDGLATLRVVFSDVGGILDAQGAVQSAAELAEAADDLEDEGFTPVDVGLERLRTAVEAAYQRTCDRGRRTGTEFMCWRDLLQGSDRRDLPAPSLREPGLALNTALLEQSDRLLDLDEFGSWYFDPEDVERYVRGLRRLPDSLTVAEERRVVSAVRTALRERVNDERRALLRDRLRRQAWFLARIYQNPTFPAAALLAAQALEDGSAVPVTEHPFLQEMMLRTFEGV